ncbi:MAG: tRNA (adenosine(37)-N6)-dimethylallyltransferase MiaA [Oscillospiraceae bacterium]|nr:tRNA (adenosine(37)-N6)-dimethylallyltransferase MiaA [Oscillospiraceae bacterium]
MSSKKVLVVAGPTASGKTSLGISLALALGGEIVSADSMQIYRRMDIGTAKATPSELARVPHHMLDVADPAEEYSVSRYVEEAARCCEELFSRGKVPVLVGGTGLYIDSLLSGRSFGPRSEDPALRASLNAKYDALGGEGLLEELRSFDPERAALLHSADKKRIVRAIEVYLLTGETITAHDAATRALPPRYESLFLIPGFRDRALLYQRIDSRVDDMVRQGLFGEVRSLLASGVPSTATSMQAIGYKEIAACLQGQISADEAIAQIKQASRRYAKRQLTWFNRRADACRLFHDDPSVPSLPEAALSVAKEFLS